MNEAMRYFYDVPVYRLKEDKYYDERAAYIRNVLYPPHGPTAETRKKLLAKDPHADDFIIGRLQSSYGGPWRFNEAIGYIRLYFFGSQIRGEYYAVQRKRIIRTRTKTFEYLAHKVVPELDIPASAESKDIYAVILEYLHRCQTELKPRYVDIGLFCAVGPYVDWRALYNGA